MVFLAFVLSLILIAVIVIALKNHHQQRQKYLAEQNLSLPPLDITPGSLLTDDSAAPEQADETAITAEMDHGPIGEWQEGQKGEWKEQCREHRQAQRFDMAIQAAELAWPQWQSYEQTALSLRAALKQSSDLPSDQQQALLQQLYRCAAEASLLYDRLDGEPDMRWQAIARLYTRQQLHDIDLPWPEIGCNELKLLTKTDRRQMLHAWGEPHRHTSAKVYARLKNS